MKNNFEEVYKELKELEGKIDNTENETEKNEYGKAYVTKIGEMPSLFYAWKESKDNGNDDIDFNDIRSNPKKLVDDMRENGITRFTFSSRWSSAIETAFAFVKAGCVLVGMTEINGRYDKFTRTQEKNPAYVFEIAA